MNDESNETLPLTVDILGTVAEHLSEVLDEFRAWNLKLAEASRLPRTLALLRKTADAGHYPTEEGELLRYEKLPEACGSF
jgi:hypothetical protein